MLLVQGLSGSRDSLMVKALLLMSLVMIMLSAELARIEGRPYETLIFADLSRC